MLAAAMNPVPLRSGASYADYLELERLADAKHEFVGGAIYAMAGGTPEHSQLAANAIYELRRALGEQPCVVYTSDLRVRVIATGLSTYPDVTVVCGGAARAADDPDAVTNPRVLLEVLSDGTEAYDRGPKFAHYRRFESLCEYVLVSQHEPRVEVFTRSGRRFVLDEATAGERIALASLGIELAVDELYRGVALTPPLAAR
jgi:Uma2 family endonuclease